MGASYVYVNVNPQNLTIYLHLRPPLRYRRIQNNFRFVIFTSATCNCESIAENSTNRYPARQWSFAAHGAIGTCKLQRRRTQRIAQMKLFKHRKTRFVTVFCFKCETRRATPFREGTRCNGRKSDIKLSTTVKNVCFKTFGSLRK